MAIHIFNVSVEFRNWFSTPTFSVTLNFRLHQNSIYYSGKSSALSLKITIDAFSFDRGFQCCFNFRMHKILPKSYIIIEVSKNKNKLIPMLALGLGMTGMKAVVILTLRKENIKLFKKVCTSWSKRSRKNIGVLFFVENPEGRIKDLSALVRAAKKSFPEGVTVVVDDYHQLLKNTHNSRKNYLDVPAALEKLAVKHNGILALFSDSTNCIECPVCLTV